VQDQRRCSQPHVGFLKDCNPPYFHQLFPSTNCVIPANGHFSPWISNATLPWRASLRDVCGVLLSSNSKIVAGYLFYRSLGNLNSSPIQVVWLFRIEFFFFWSRGIWVIILGEGHRTRLSRWPHGPYEGPLPPNQSNVRCKDILSPLLDVQKIVPGYSR
jgi:hypothetical protein